LKNVDQRLHAERTAGAQRVARLKHLPDGVIVVPQGWSAPCLWWGGNLLEWTFSGYRPFTPASLPASVLVITPESLVKVLGAGYAVAVHHSANCQTGPHEF
jgi:hypothetical protein